MSYNFYNLKEVKDDFIFDDLKIKVPKNYVEIFEESWLEILNNTLIFYFKDEKKCYVLEFFKQGLKEFDLNDEVTVWKTVTFESTKNLNEFLLSII